MYGYLRETQEDAIKAGNDQLTGICRTGLDVYLKEIFPNVDDWVHDKSIKELGIRTRPDYRSETLKMIVEFDGLQHYTNPENIIKDIEKTKVYESHGYEVVRIPYFIQLTREVIIELFGVDVCKEMFDSKYPSMSVKNKNTPAYMCSSGVERMNEEFKRFPEQFEVNYDSLSKEGLLSGVGLMKVGV